MPQFVAGAAEETRLDGSRGAGSQPEAAGDDAVMRKLFPRMFTDAADQRGDLPVIAHVHQQLGISGVGFFRRIGQDEPERTAADAARDIADARQSPHIRLHLGRGPIGFIDRSAVRQPDIHQKLRPRRIRKEIASDSGKHHQSGKEKDDQQRDRNDPVAQDPVEPVYIYKEKTGPVGIGFRIRTRPESVTAEQRRDGDRGQPAQ